MKTKTFVSHFCSGLLIFFFLVSIGWVRAEGNGTVDASAFPVIKISISTDEKVENSSEVSVSEKGQEIPAEIKISGGGRKIDISYHSRVQKDGKRHEVLVKINGKNNDFYFIAPKGGGNSQIILFIGIGLLVISAGAAAWYFFGSGSKTNEAATPAWVTPKEDKPLSIEISQKENLLPPETSAQTQKEHLPENQPPASVEKTSLGNKLTPEQEAAIRQIEIQTAAKRTANIPPAANFPSLQLVVEIGIETKTCPITKERTTLGRNPANDICIQDSTVSGYHAVLSIENGEIIITDNNSTNKTFVNGTQISRATLQVGDKIRFGAVVVTLTSA